MFFGRMTLTSPNFIASISQAAKYSTGEKMIVRTYRSKHFIRMTVIALCLTAAYSPVVAPQETKKEADLSCTSSNAASPCPSATAGKEIPETQRQAANLTGIPEAQDHNNPPGSSFHPRAENSTVLFLPVNTS